jgi:surface antigen
VVPASLESTKIYRRFRSQMRRKTVRKRAVRASLLVGNIALLVVILFFVLQRPDKTPVIAPAVLSQSASTKAVMNPLDQLSSSDIAVNVAHLTSVPETTAIINQADSQAAIVTSTQTSGDVVTKPQVVSTATKSKADIQSYTVKDGDTLASIAAQFGVTSDSIRWSNNMSNATVTAGSNLTIPPVNGIVYTVKSGDTTDSLATKYKANKDKIVEFNDAEINGLQIGEVIVIPDATQQIVVPAAQVSSSYSGSGGVAYGWGGPTYGGNAYAYGYCTWYVASRLPVPSNWGNANTWDNLAPLSGWTKSRTPKVGAIAQTDAGYAGHVGIVEAVSDDGTQIKWSDMNGIAGWGRVGYSDWAPSDHFQWYIYQ